MNEARQVHQHRRMHLQVHQHSILQVNRYIVNFTFEYVAFSIYTTIQPWTYAQNSFTSFSPFPLTTSSSVTPGGSRTPSLLTHAAPTPLPHPHHNPFALPFATPPRLPHTYLNLYCPYHYSTPTHRILPTTSCLSLRRFPIRVVLIINHNCSYYSDISSPVVLDSPLDPSSPNSSWVVACLYVRPSTQFLRNLPVCRE